METIHTLYEGELRTLAKHLGSGKTLITDAPLDNQGKGEAFSPTDLLAASLGSCMVTIMGIAARTHGMNIDGTKLRITKIMASQPRRVSEIKIELDMPDQPYSDKDKKLLEHAARTCPVALSLHPDILQSIKFHW